MQLFDSSVEHIPRARTHCVICRFTFAYMAIILMLMMSASPKAFIDRLGRYEFIHNENLDHIPSSFIDLMVHVVKGCQYTTRHIDACTSIAETKSETIYYLC